MKFTHKNKPVIDLLGGTTIETLSEREFEKILIAIDIGIYCSIPIAFYGNIEN